MLDKNQLYIVRQAHNVLRSGKYGWHKGRVAYDMLGRPCEIESENAGHFDIFGLIDRVNYDNGLVAKRIEPIFATFKAVIIARSIGDTHAANLQQWNDSPVTELNDILFLLDIVSQTNTMPASAYDVAVAAE